jgi:hypothetical protein
MLSRNDPRFRRALDQLAAGLESASSRAQEGAFAFSQAYVSPCLASTQTCLAATIEPCRACWEEEEQRRRRQQQQARDRAELSFDFYDDMDAEAETDPLLGGGDDGDGDALEEGPASAATASGGGGWFRGRARERPMTYGAVGGGPAGKGGSGKGKQRMAPPPEEDGAPIIRSSSYFGFLESLPFRPGAKGLRYQPSIADLQDHPGSRRQLYSEEEPLMDGSDAEERDAAKANAPAMRTRSGTQGSGHTTDSFSSRGDIFPSEDEMDDAVPLDDEFALHLERRTTGHGSNEDRSSSGRNRSSASSLKSRGSSGALKSRGSSGARQPRSAHRLPPPENRILSPASLYEPPGNVGGDNERRRIPLRSKSSPELDNVAASQFLVKSGARSPGANGSAMATSPPDLSPPVAEAKSISPPVVTTLPLPGIGTDHTPSDAQPSPASKQWVAAALPNFSPSPT